MYGRRVAYRRRPVLFGRGPLYCGVCARHRGRARLCCDAKQVECSVRGWRRKERSQGTIRRLCATRAVGHVCDAGLLPPAGCARARRSCAAGARVCPGGDEGQRGASASSEAEPEEIQVARARHLFVQRVDFRDGESDAQLCAERCGPCGRRAQPYGCASRRDQVSVERARAAVYARERQRSGVVPLRGGWGSRGH